MTPEPTSRPKAYVGLFKDNAVAVLDTSTNQVLSTIPVPPGPHGLVVTPDGRKVYVSSDGASTVSVIDTATDRVVRQIEVGPTPHGLAISPDGRQVLVAGFGANHAVLNDTTSDQVVGQIPVPQPHNSAIGRSRAHVQVSMLSAPLVRGGAPKRRGYHGGPSEAVAQTFFERPGSARRSR